MQRIMASGDGRTTATAYVVEGMLWEYPVLKRLGLRFVHQTSSIENGHPQDVITAREPGSRGSSEIIFKVVPDRSRAADAGGLTRYDAGTDAIARNIMTSGDGTTPDTAFVVGGSTEVEYFILDVLGLQPQLQALRTIRGCAFDVLLAHEQTDKNAAPVYFKPVYFKLAPGCILAPDGGPAFDPHRAK